MTSGVFEVPDTAPHAPPARVHFKMEGPVPAAAELLRMDRLRDVSDLPFEPSAMRGNLTAQVTLGMPLKADLPPGSTNYAIAIEATNFSADRMIMGQKVEASVLRANATPQGFQLKGDVKIAGAPVNLEYRKSRGDADAEVRLQGMLDEAARNNLGFEVGDAVSGAQFRIRLAGRVAIGVRPRRPFHRRGRSHVGDRSTGCCRAGSKPSGKPARATFTLTTKPQSIRIEDLLIEGAGVGVKGTIDLDGIRRSAIGELPDLRLLRRRPRQPEGRAQRARARCVSIMRGEVYDGRGFVKSAAGATPSNSNAKRRSVDFDLDMKVGAVVGFNGEALRGVDLKMSRRAGEVRSFGLSAKIGRDATLTGDLRGRSERPPGGLPGEQRRRRLLSLHRHLFAHDRRANVDRDGSAVGGQCDAAGHAHRPQFRRPRRSAARTRGQQRHAGPPQRDRFLRHAGRIHPHAGQGRRCATAWCADRCSAAPSTAWSITGTTKCTCAARWCRSTARTICSGNCRCSGLFMGGEKEGLVRHHLRSRRPAGQSGAAHQSDFGAGAGPVAQGVRVPRQWRQRQRRAADTPALTHPDVVSRAVL